MWYIVGLGNPGEQYHHTRHNIGRDALLVLSERWSLPAWQKDKPANAQLTQGDLGDVEVTAVLPETFMNKSGDSLRYFKEKQGMKPDTCIVVYDDVDLPFGEVKISMNRGDGGHNGIKSIISQLKSKECIRVRVGVAQKSFWTGKVRRPEGAPLPRHVLARFSGSEQKKLPAIYEKVGDILVTIVNEGPAAAMNRYN